MAKARKCSWKRRLAPHRVEREIVFGPWVGAFGRSRALRGPSACAGVCRGRFTPLVSLAWWELKSGRHFWPTRSTLAFISSTRTHRSPLPTSSSAQYVHVQALQAQRRFVSPSAEAAALRCRAAATHDTGFPAQKTWQLHCQAPRQEMVFPWTRSSSI